MKKEQPSLLSQSCSLALLPDETAVLLDTHSGQFFRFNKSARTMLDLLRTGKTFQESVQELVRRYMVAPDVVSRDLEHLMASLKEYHLLSEEADASPRVASWPACSWSDRLTYPGVLEVVEAFFTVRHAQTLLTEGLPYAAHYVAALPAAIQVTANHPKVIRLSRLIRRVASLHPSQRCLHQSFALAVMLRRRGFLADVCIGICTHPFTSHAWVQSADTIIQWEAGLSHPDERFLQALTIIFRSSEEQ